MRPDEGAMPATPGQARTAASEQFHRATSRVAYDSAIIPFDAHESPNALDDCTGLVPNTGRAVFLARHLLGHRELGAFAASRRARARRGGWLWTWTDASAVCLRGVRCAAVAVRGSAGGTELFSSSEAASGEPEDRVGRRGALLRSSFARVRAASCRQVPWVAPCPSVVDVGARPEAVVQLWPQSGRLFPSSTPGFLFMQVEPQAARFHVEVTPDGLRVVIPARRNWFVVLFLIAWLGGWVFGEASASSQLLRHEDNDTAFLAFWLLGWTIGGAFAATAVVWQLAGREIISITSSTLLHRAEAFGLGWSRSYKASEVRNLRSTEYASSALANQRSWLPPVTGSGFGPVAFDYGARTIRMAPSLEEAEAKMLVLELSPRLPRRVS